MLENALFQLESNMDGCTTKREGHCLDRISPISHSHNYVLLILVVTNQMCVMSLTYNLSHRGWKNSFYSQPAPPPPHPSTYVLTLNTFNYNTSFYFTISHIQRGNGDAYTLSVDLRFPPYVFYAICPHNLPMNVASLAIPLVR